MRSFVTSSILLILIQILSSTNLLAQEKPFDYCRTVAPWEDFIVDSTIDIDKVGTLVVTNRPYFPGEKEFLKNDIANWRMVKYFLAYCESDKWHLTLVDSLEAGLDAINKGGDIVLFVHGNGKTFPEAITRANIIRKRYDIGMVLFDWPSKNRHFFYSQARVRHCAENFYNINLQLKDYREHSMEKDQHLSLFAHSLGNYFLSHLVVNGNNQYLKEVIYDNVIFNAAAIKSRDHGKVLSQLKFQKQIYVVLNKNDKALRGANLINYGKMLGNTTVYPLAQNTEYIHFTTIAGKDHTYFAGYHQYEFDNPAVFDFYNTILHGGKVNFENQKFYKKRTSGDGFDILDAQIVD